MLLSSKLFEVKRNGVRDDVLTSNFLFDNILMTRVSLTLLQSVRVDVSDESTDS